MKFFYENSMGDSGIFSERNLVRGIYSAWNIEANLYLITDKNVKKVKDIKSFNTQTKLIFAPWEGNEFNSDLLKEFGYYVIDGEHEVEIRKIDTNEVVKYDWGEVKQLI